MCSLCLCLNDHVSIIFYTMLTFLSRDAPKSRHLAMMQTYYKYRYTHIVYEYIHIAQRRKEDDKRITYAHTRIRVYYRNEIVAVLFSWIFKFI